MEMMPVIETPFEILAADIVGPLPMTVRKTVRKQIHTHNDGSDQQISRGHTTFKQATA